MIHGGKTKAINGLLLGNHRQQVRFVHANIFVGGMRILVLNTEAQKNALFGFSIGSFSSKIC